MITATNKKKLLVVDDESLLREILSDVLSAAGYLVDMAQNGKKALHLLDNNIYDLTISDVHMPEMDGISLFRKVTEGLPELKKRFLFITGNPTNEVLSFFKVNNLEYITKPFQIPDILDKVSSMIDEDINLNGRKGMYWRKEERFSCSAYCGIGSIEAEKRSDSTPHIAKTENITKNGVKIRYRGEPLTLGKRINIYIMSLNVQRDARVVWSKTINETDSHAGLEFDKPIPPILQKML